MPERVHEPRLSHASDAVVEGLRANVVGRGLPFEAARAASARPLGAPFDQPLGEACSSRLRRDVEVVHDADARSLRRVPGPKHARESNRSSRAVAGDQLNTLVLRIGEHGAREREQLDIVRRRLVEVAVGAHQRKQIVEILLADDLDRVPLAHLMHSRIVRTSGAAAYHARIAGNLHSATQPGRARE